VAFNEYGVKLLRNGLLRMKNGQMQALSIRHSFCALNGTDRM
jgi:hypothetical protein